MKHSPMDIKQITSSQNPEVKAIAKLHTVKGRKTQGLFIAEGKRALQTFTDAGWEPLSIYATENNYHTAVGIFDSQAISLFDEEKITQVNDEVMGKISAAQTPSGILAVFHIPKQLPFDQLSSGIVLTRIADPGNMGTLIRSAAAFGKKTIINIESCDPWSPKVVQASAGTIALAHIFQITWEELTTNKNNLSLVALVVKDGKKPSDLELQNALLVVGSEAHGIPDAWLKQCDQRMTLPMQGAAESLNAAVAGSIALYATSSSVTNK